MNLLSPILVKASYAVASLALISAVLFYGLWQSTSGDLESLKTQYNQSQALLEDCNKSKQKLLDSYQSTEKIVDNHQTALRGLEDEEDKFVQQLNNMSSNDCLVKNTKTEAVKSDKKANVADLNDQLPDDLAGLLDTVHRQGSSSSTSR